MIAPVLLVRPEIYDKIKASMNMTIPYPAGSSPEWMQMVGLRIEQSTYIPQFTTVERRIRRAWVEPKRRSWSYRPAYRTVRVQVPVLGWWLSAKDVIMQPVLMEDCR